MKERPILFSTLMVQALLAGNKTQTRRIVKEPYQSYPCVTKHLTSSEFDFHFDQGVGQFTASPYGKPGDILWVRETAYNTVQGYVYKADKTKDELNEFQKWGFKWKPSIHMPKEACRIKLQITDIRVERLHDIMSPSRELDAQAEGVNLGYEDSDGGVFSSYRKGFKDIWHKINGLDSWKKNPWVWVIMFKAK